MQELWLSEALTGWGPGGVSMEAVHVFTENKQLCREAQPIGLCSAVLAVLCRAAVIPGSCFRWYQLNRTCNQRVSKIT